MVDFLKPYNYYSLLGQSLTYRQHNLKNTLGTFVIGTHLLGRTFVIGTHLLSGTFVIGTHLLSGTLLLLGHICCWDTFVNQDTFANWDTFVNQDTFVVGTLLDAFVQDT